MDSKFIIKRGHWPEGQRYSYSLPHLMASHAPSPWPGVIIVVVRCKSPHFRNYRCKYTAGNGCINRKKLIVSLSKISNIVSEEHQSRTLLPIEGGRVDPQTKYIVINAPQM